jgi:uncharacterized protein YndB with AHSA1/START domain
MTVTAVRKDPETYTMTLDAEFDASPERVWQLWADPRQLDGWWGHPSYPATFTKLDLTPGSIIEYYMTGPDGNRIPGTWRVAEAAAPNWLVLRDADVNEEGVPNDGFGLTMMRVRIEAITPGRTRMTIDTVFGSTEGMEQMVSAGFEEGMVLSVGRIDVLLADDAAVTH